MRYELELRTAYGRRIWAVIDSYTMRTVARCDTHDDAKLVRDGLNATMPQAV